MTYPSPPNPDSQNQNQQFQNPASQSSQQPPSAPQPQYQQNPQYPGQTGEPQYSAPGQYGNPTDQQYGAPGQQYGGAQQSYGGGQQYGGGQYGTPGGPAAQGPKKPNILAFIALGLAVVGTILACIPVTMWVGWILLPVSFILAIISIFLPQMQKLFGIIAAGVSVVGTIAGFIVFFIVLGTAFTDIAAPEETGSETDTVATETDDSDDPIETDDSDGPTDVAGDGEGTRDDPIPLGTTYEGSEWSFVVNTTEFNANDAVEDENMFNEPPESGNVWILINVTLTYTGDNPDGDTNYFGLEYITPGGNAISWTDHLVVEPDGFNWGETLYNGASKSGNIGFQVPLENVEDGVVALQLDYSDDKVYFALR